jgi:hypothetical protein
MDLAERHGFSMRLSWWVGVAARNNNPTFDEDTPYWRIGEARGEGLSPFFERFAHEVFKTFVHMVYPISMEDLTRQLSRAPKGHRS